MTNSTYMDRDVLQIYLLFTLGCELQRWPLTLPQGILPLFPNKWQNMKTFFYLIVSLNPLFFCFTDMNFKKFLWDRSRADGCNEMHASIQTPSLLLGTSTRRREFQAIRIPGLSHQVGLWVRGHPNTEEGPRIHIPLGSEPPLPLPASRHLRSHTMQNNGQVSSPVAHRSICQCLKINGNTLS